MTFRSHSDAIDTLKQAYRKISDAGRDEVFLHLISEKDALAALDDAFSAHPEGELTGAILAVKDNIDVAGMPTTSACPGYEYQPDADAAVVAELRSAGAVIIGKTNLDQFATGLVGTRSPYGAVRHAERPERISGGSSSGSAVAVAMGFVDAALGTDTAGSGRVPAGLHGLVGIKPSLGLVSNEGLVPACKSYDAITVFARITDTASTVMSVMARSGQRDFGSAIAVSAPETPVVGIPRELPELNEAWQAAFAAAVEKLQAAGVEVREIDLQPSLDAAKMLYDSALVAERAEAVGEFVTEHEGNDSAGLDPTVRTIVLGGTKFSGAEVLAARRELERREQVAKAAWGDVDALMIPTAPFHPDIDTVNADPIAVNSKMGSYTNFCNLFDLCAVAVPAGEASDGGTLGSAAPAHFGVTFLAPALADDLIFDIAERFEASDARKENPTSGAWLADLAKERDTLIELTVWGAHLRGQPLNHQLRDLGAVFVRDVTTTDNHRLYALNTTPPKPGLTTSNDESGSAIAGELWHISPAGLGHFLAALPKPMTLGEVDLSDGSATVGFSFSPGELANSTEITEFGGWRAYLAR